MKKFVKRSLAAITVLCLMTLGLMLAGCGDGSSGVSSQVVSGNAAVALASEKFPYPAIVLGEMLATSDLPGGVINLLTGFRKEIVPTFATHAHLRAVGGVLSLEERKQVELGAAESVKRARIRFADEALDWYAESAQSLYLIKDYLEFKTTWHPIGA